MLSDARELASDQQLDADVYIVGPEAGISIVRELSGNRASICLLSVRPGIRCFGWVLQSMQLDLSADTRAVAGLRPIDYDRHCWPDIALENRHPVRISCQAHAHGRSNPTLPVVPPAPRRADDLKKQLAD